MPDNHIGNQSQQSEDEKPYQLISLKLADRLATLEITHDDLTRVSGIAETMFSHAQATMERTRRAYDVFRAKRSSIDSLNDFNRNRCEALRTHLQDCFPEGHPAYFKDLAKGYLKYGNVICSRLEELIVDGSDIESKQLEALNQTVEALVCSRACKEMTRRRELHKENMPAHQEHNEACLQVEQNHTMSIDELAAEVETYYRVFIRLLDTG